jgi:antirestriction protein ArdC
MTATQLNPFCLTLLGCRPKASVCSTINLEPTQMRDTYPNITNKILTELEAGMPPWIKPCKDRQADGVPPFNAKSLRPYDGYQYAVALV